MCPALTTAGLYNGTVRVTFGKAPLPKDNITIHCSQKIGIVS